MKTTTLLLLAGINDSGPGHWQTLWQQADPAIAKLEHDEWDRPDRLRWVQELEAEVDRLGPRVTLVAHSLACLLVAHWAATTRHAIDGALLVSVPDPDGPAFPKDAKHFGRIPMLRLPFASTVVCSSDDPYGSEACMRGWAQTWGSRFVCIGARGHVNAASGLGTWDEGRTILRELTSRS